MTNAVRAAFEEWWGDAVLPVTDHTSVGYTKEALLWAYEAACNRAIEDAANACQELAHKLMDEAFALSIARDNIRKLGR